MRNQKKKIKKNIIRKEGKKMKCPKCGGPMRKVVAKKGSNAGNPFWSCQAYPNCNGTRKWDWK